MSVVIVSMLESILFWRRKKKLKQEPERFEPGDMVYAFDTTIRGVERTCTFIKYRDVSRSKHPVDNAHEYY